MSYPVPDNLQVSKHDSVEMWQLIPLVLAAMLLTIGLAMFMSGTQHPVEIIQPVIVVFGVRFVAAAKRSHTFTRGCCVLCAAVVFCVSSDSEISAWEKHKC